MSSINPNNIDGTYPIAGQDNDSQGFRDNFTNIKNNFTFAASEVSDLQNNAILKAPLSGTTLNNNLNNAQLIGAQISKFTETRWDLGTQTGSVTVNWSDAHFQTITTSGSITLTLASWPTSGFFTKLVIDVNVTNIAHTLTLPSAVSVNIQDIQGVVITGGVPTITFPATGVYRYVFTTYDGGTTIAIEDVFNTYQSIPYQYYAPSGNVFLTANVGVSRFILDPVTPTVSLYANITLPAANLDAKTITISSTQTVQFLSVMPNTGTTISNPGNITLSAGTAATYFYHASDTKWYKIG